MTTAACDRCNKSVPADQLIPNAGKRICLECESDIEDTKRLRSSVYRSIASVPIAIIVGWLTICIPYLNVLIFPLMAVAAVVVAVQAIRLGLSIRQAPEEYGVGDAEPIILIVLGALAGVSSLGQIGVSLLLLLGGVLALSMS